MVSDVEVEVSDSGGRSRGGALSLDDCHCPVCLEIFMEPVTLPCTHTFCKDCFLESVDKTTLCCPLCRKRVSTWARLNSRNKTLVNMQLWTQIQLCFPLQCQRRLNGQDTVVEDNPGVSVCFPRVCQPGELKQEYEDQVTKVMEEKRVLDEEERRASEEYIQRLLAEEEELLQEERRRREEDERLARQLSSQLNSAPVSQDNVGGAIVTPAKKKKKKEVSAGQMERFLCPLPSNSSSSDCSFMANKENILLPQVALQVECPVPELDYYRQKDRPDHQVVSPSEPHSSSAEVQLHPRSHRSHLTAGEGPLTSKRKSSEMETSEEEEEEEEVTVTKRGCPSSSTLAGVGFAEPGITGREVELQSRWKQEEQDRKLALLLQKELDQEERQRATDRRKGSSDPYLLRQNSRGKVETNSSDAPTRSSRRTSKTSTPSSATPSTPSSATPSTPSSATPSTPSSAKTTTSIPASSVKTKETSSSSPSSRGSKQVTLTEMFSGVSSRTTSGLCPSRAEPDIS